MKKKNKNNPEAPVTKAGAIIAIRSRLCADTVQPRMMVGKVLRVQKVSTLKSGAARLECVEHEATAKGKPRRVTVNAERFAWERVTEAEVAYAAEKAKEACRKITEYRMARARKQYEEKRFKRDVERTVKVLAETMTWDEHVEITIKPLIAIEMVWLVAEECRRYCAEQKIGQVLKVTRAIRALREEYDAFLLRDLNSRQRDDLTRQARLLMEESPLAHHTHIVRLTLRNEYFKQFPGVNIPYLDLRIVATLGVLFIAAYRRRVETANRLIREKAGDRIDRSISNPLITDRLYAQLDALLGDFVLQPSRDIETYEKIVDNALCLTKVSPKKPEQQAS